MDTYECRRNHILRFFALYEFREPVLIDLPTGHIIGGYVFPSGRAVKGLHGGILYSLEHPDHAFHLTELNPESAYFHLPVIAPDEVDRTIRESPHYVPGAVNSSVTRLITEGIGNKRLFCQFGLIEVAFCYPVSRDPQFTGSTYRKLGSVLSHHISFIIVKRPPDRYTESIFFNRKDRGKYGAFGRAVSVVESVVTLRGKRNKFFAAGHKILYFGSRHGCREHPRHLRRQKGMSHMILFKAGIQFGQVQPHFLGDDADGSARGQGRVQIHHARVKAKARVRGNGRVFGKPEVFPVPLTEVHQIPVRQHNAFRDARGTGSVKKDE